jgi:hypothetical protein
MFGILVELDVAVRAVNGINKHRALNAFEYYPQENIISYTLFAHIEQGEDI